MLLLPYVNVPISTTDKETFSLVIVIAIVNGNILIVLNTFCWDESGKSNFKIQRRVTCAD